MQFQAKKTNINERGNKVNITISTDDPEVMKELLNIPTKERPYMDSKVETAKKSTTKKTKAKVRALASPKKEVKKPKKVCAKTSTKKTKEGKTVKKTAPKKTASKQTKKKAKKEAENKILYDNGRFKIWHESNGYVMYDTNTGDKYKIYFEDDYQKALAEFKKKMRLAYQRQ